MMMIIRPIGQSVSAGKWPSPVAIGGSTSKHVMPAKSNGMMMSSIRCQSFRGGDHQIRQKSMVFPSLFACSSAVKAPGKNSISCRSDESVFMGFCHLSSGSFLSGEYITQLMLRMPLRYHMGVSGPTFLVAWAQGYFWPILLRLSADQLE